METWKGRSYPVSECCKHCLKSPRVPVPEASRMCNQSANNYFLEECKKKLMNVNTDPVKDDLKKKINSHLKNRLHYNQRAIRMTRQYISPDK